MSLGALDDLISEALESLSALLCVLVGSVRKPVHLHITPVTEAMLA